MDKKPFLIILIGEFILILILGFYLYDTKNNETLKEQQNDKCDCILPQEIEYECIFEEKREENAHKQFTKKYIKADLKGKVLDVKTTKHNVFDNQKECDDYKNNLVYDETVYELQEKELEIILYEKTETINESWSYIDYEEMMQNNGFICEAIK